MKKSVKGFSANIVSKDIVSKKKRKDGVLKNSAAQKMVMSNKAVGSFWRSETGDTTKSDSVDMEEKFLIEKTSVDYGKSDLLEGKDVDQTPKGPKVVTKQALGKSLGKINFLGNDDNNVLLDGHLELPLPLKNLVNVSVRKSFALDIGLEKVTEKSSQEKLSAIIRAMFTSELSLVQASKKAGDAKILVNTDLKKPTGCSDRAVVVKKILVGTLVKTMCAALSEFGSVVSIKMQLVELWQKAVIEFAQLDQADLVAARWFILIGKNAMRVAKANLDKELCNTRNQHRALLYTLPMGTNAHNIWDFIGSVSRKTYVIDQHPITYAQTRCVIVCFDSAALINAVMETTPVLKGANLCWAHLSSAKCAKCGNLGHTSLNCSVGGKTSSGGLACRILSEDDKSRLASIYARRSAPISHPVSFSSISWANIVGGSFFPSLLVHDKSASSGSSSEIKPTPLVSVKLNNRFATLEHSLISFVEHVDKLAKRLNSPGPTNQEVNIVMSKGSDIATSGETIVEVVVFDLSVVSKMEETLHNLSVTVMGLLAKIDNAGLVLNKITTCNACGIIVSAKQKDVVCWHIDSGNMSIVMEMKLRSNVRPWIMNKFDGVKIFSSGLDNEFLGAGVMIIVNNSLAYHFSKGKLSVVILGLYAGASAEIRFGQACEINSLIAKTANSSTFMVLGGNFNEDESRKSASLKFCSDLGLINSFSGHSLAKASTWGNSWGVMKVINYIFVSKSLSSALAGHEVTFVSNFFDTDHNAVLVSIGLGGFLDSHLNNADANKWLHFRECSLDKFLENMVSFNDAKRILKDVVFYSADKVFSKHWFSEFDCLKNKLSLKFFKLELLVAKLVKCLSLDQELDAVRLFKVWSNLDSKGASKACTMFNDNENRSKYYEFRMARNILIRRAIDKQIENFSSNKELMIKSVLDQPFKKVVLDHLILNDELILEPKEVKSAIDNIMEGWTKKWSNQYAPLDHVSDDAFSKVMNMIKLDEFFLVVKELPDGKAAGMSGVSNELWKHRDAQILGGLLDILNVCLKLRAVPSEWRQAWVSMIPKPYDWEGTLTNTRPIALIKTARKILFKKITTCNACGINVSAKQKDVVCWHIDSGNMSIVMEMKLRSNVRPWIMNKFDGVKIFSSGLDNEFLGAGVMIILLFKGKLSVVILGLYAGASAEIRFGQACEINSLIAKTANSSTFMVLGGNFNEDESRKSASLKFCSDLGLINSFSGHSLAKASTWGNSWGVMKVINYIFVSKSLSSALAGHEVTFVSNFFDTDHNAVLVSIGLGGFLDSHLNNADANKWLHFRECSLDKFLENMVSFNDAKRILKDVVFYSADKVFSKHWFSEFDCLKNKLSLKFFKLELLVAKLVKCLSLDQELDAVRLFKVWSNLDSKGASKACTMFNDNENRSKYYEFRMARNILIRRAIDKQIENFSSNKELMIKSVLDQPFKKVVLDHLILNDELILEPKEVKSAIDNIMEGWTKKWSNQYAPLDHVSDDAFSKVMNMIKLDEFFLVVKELPDGKAAGMSGVSNELWKHRDAQILGGLLDILNVCLKLRAVPSEWRQAWVSMIPKPYDWEGTLTNTRPIALIKTARKILFKVLTSKANPKGGKTSFFAAGAFVDDTIWVGNCLVATQCILNIASEFFLINDIVINTDKTVAIPINQGAKKISLSINGSKISIAKKNGLSKPSLAKVYSDIRFFSNVVLRKTITEKQFLYLVSAVLQPIISYRLQFSCISKSVCEKWNKILRKKLKLKANLPKDFPNEALAMELQATSWMPQHSLRVLINLLIDLTNCFLAGATCVLKLCNFSLGGNLPDVFWAKNSIAVLDVLGLEFYLCVARSLRRYGIVFNTFRRWKKLDPRGPVPVWFVFLVEFIKGDGLSNHVVLSHCSALADSSCDFGYVNEYLLNSDLSSVTVYTDSSVKGLGSSGVCGGAATYFLDANINIEIKVDGLLSLTLVELQAIALALECVPTSWSVNLFTNSQALLDLCKSGSDLLVTWNKVKSHFGVVENKHANFYANAAVASKFFLPLVVPYRFLRVENRHVSRNAHYIAKKLFNAVHSVGWKAKYVGSFVSAGLCNHFDKAKIFCVWHPDGKIKSGYTSNASATLRSYFMKVLYHHLPVAKRKKLYNLRYPSIACIWCELVENSDHVFSCAYDVNV
ncbi:hypothetical protein G9A89_013525 [Geosiphon pyriformis]|nr:hypothetical protein G9A89_013525 [Geosiphon pyriformis]